MGLLQQECVAFCPFLNIKLLVTFINHDSQPNPHLEILKYILESKSNPKKYQFLYFDSFGN